MLFFISALTSSSLPRSWTIFEWIRSIIGSSVTMVRTVNTAILLFVRSAGAKAGGSEAAREAGQKQRQDKSLFHGNTCPTGFVKGGFCPYSPFRLLK